MNKDIEYIKKYGKNININEAIERLKKGEPVQYIIGDVNFYGNIIKVNHNVLIPRFETEDLVDKTIKYIKKYLNDNISIIDLGTGSGCIAITLKKVFSSSDVDAVDISVNALEIARENAILNNVDVNFIEGNMLDKINKKYDLIISNPPYISYDEEIMDIVKNNEPHIALYAENNGLQFYEEILMNAQKNIKEKSIIAFEIGDKQADSIKNIISNYFPNSIVKVEKDMQNRDRFIFVFNGINI